MTFQEFPGVSCETGVFPGMSGPPFPESVRGGALAKRWYVVQSRSSQEIRAWVAITALGYPMFFPQYSEHLRGRRLTAARKAGESDFELLALFPSYMFVEFDLDDGEEDWGSILRARGVFTLLGMRRTTRFAGSGAEVDAWIGVPAALPPVVVTELLAWRDHGAELSDEKPDTKRTGRLMAGEPVQVRRADRILKGLVQVDQGRRVRVLLDMLGRSVPTMVDRDSVELR